MDSLDSSDDQILLYTTPISPIERDLVDEKAIFNDTSQNEVLYTPKISVNVCLYSMYCTCFFYSHQNLI